MIIALIAAILALGGIFYLTVKYKNGRISDLHVVNLELAAELKLKEKSIKMMKEHAKRINLTEEEVEPIKQEIKDAKTDEDVILAIGNVLKRNNIRIMPDNG